MAIIKADGVSIRYLTGDFKDIGLKEYVVRRIKGNYHVEEFWADRHVSFELEQGDMLGIIGSNGAGKSTLLKAVSGIMVPTEGHMEINGSIAALLELASGFDGEMTVKENTYLRGAMLGYTRKFMDEKYDEIIAFAELEEFQDRPFKNLSSGMKSRLAFSIACLVHPDILILDEVLSVGDGAFRKKSGDKMKEILSNGVTGILVSHSVDQVREMCNKILWLDHGKQITFNDQVERTCDAYEEFLRTKKLPHSEAEIDRLAQAHQDYLRMEREKSGKPRSKSSRGFWKRPERMRRFMRRCPSCGTEPRNCWLTTVWVQVLPNSSRYWIDLSKLLAGFITEVEHGEQVETIDCASPGADHVYEYVPGRRLCPGRACGWGKTRIPGDDGRDRRGESGTFRRRTLWRCFH